MTDGQQPITMGVVVAVKGLRHAKSRLSATDAPVPGPLRRRLAQTMTYDTLAALGAVADHVVVVSDQPGLRAVLGLEGLDVEVVAERPGGMNAALLQGARWLLEAHAPQLLLAVVADLPAVRVPTLQRIRAGAVHHERSFLADATGVGTTMLAARTEAGPAAFAPRFQGRSAAAHRSGGAHPLDDRDTDGPVADARRDVDTVVDLYDAWGLGLGARTGLLVDPASGALRDYDAVTVTGGSSAVITSDGRRLALPEAAWPVGDLRPASGQRLHAVLADGRAVTTWR